MPENLPDKCAACKRAIELGFHLGTGKTIAALPTEGIDSQDGVSKDPTCQENMNFGRCEAFEWFKKKRI